MANPDFLRGAPLFLQRRYGSIRAYVRSIIEADFPSLEIRRIDPDDLDTIYLVVFVYVLREFFEDGYKAASDAVRVLQPFDIREFTIGSTTFSEGNEAVMRGRVLANDLLDRIHNEALKAMILRSESIGELVHNLVEFL